MIDEYQSKRSCLRLPVYDEFGQIFTYKNKHADISTDTGNDFYTLIANKEKDEKIVRWHNDAGNVSLSDINIDEARSLVQSAVDCFRM